VNKGTVYFIHALSPLHPGVGQGVGSVDLPVAREKATGIPYLPGSSVKGVLRDAARTQDWPESKIKAIFGPDTDHAREHAGAAYFSDAKLLLLPVRSYAGVFAYATSPYLLKRFHREAVMAGLDPHSPPDGLSTQEALVSEGRKVAEGDRVYLEDLDFKAEPDPAVSSWETWLTEHTPGLDVPLEGRLLILSDDAMSFLLESALEVVTRIRIDENTKTVAKGALWFEENLPAESLLYGLLSVAPKAFGGEPIEGQAILTELKNLTRTTLQFGGNATVGRGLARMVFAGGKA